MFFIKWIGDWLFWYISPEDSLLNDTKAWCTSLMKGKRILKYLLPAFLSSFPAIACQLCIRAPLTRSWTKSRNQLWTVIAEFKIFFNNKKYFRTHFILNTFFSFEIFFSHFNNNFWVCCHLQETSSLKKLKSFDAFAFVTVWRYLKLNKV